MPLFAKDHEIDVHLCIQNDQIQLLPDNIENVTLHTLPKHYGFWRVQVWEQFFLPRLARRIGAEVTFSPANYGPILARNSVILIRNAIGVAFVERRLTKFAYWAAVYVGTALSLMTCKKALAVSDYARRTTAAGILKRFRDRIAVIPHGINRAFSPPANGRERQNFILAVSDIYVQKNLKNLLLAIARLAPYHDNIVLKVAGNFIDQEYWESLKSILSENGLEKHVEFLGPVSPEGLVDLYKDCAVFVFPSLVETFGNPLVEAMASATPIASSESAAMPEVVGDAGLFFDPTDVDEIAVAINRLIRNPDICEDLSKKAEIRAKAFSWEATAARTLDIIKDVATSSS